MSSKKIESSKAPEPVGLYPHARQVGNLLFLSGVGPRERGTKKIPGVELDNQGMLLSKEFYNKDDMNKLKFDEDITSINYQKKSFIYNILYSLRQKIDDPLNKKRIKN